MFLVVLHGVDQRELLVGQRRVSMLLTSPVDGDDRLENPTVAVEPQVERVLDPWVWLESRGTAEHQLVLVRDRLALGCQEDRVPVRPALLDSTEAAVVLSG